MSYDKIDDFFADIRDKQIAVIGIGVSNTPLIKMLVQHGAKVIAHDKKTKDELGVIADELENMNVTLCLGEHYLDEILADIVFKTPGLRFDHPALLKASERGSRITSEMEVFFALCPCPIIAVTGSDGKTTTTTLISEMLKRAGKTVHLGGNIGKPLLPEIENIHPTDITVVELSSFQLHTMRQSPHIAVVTNLAPNHLDMHKDMAEYIDAKKNIFLYQNPDDILVLNQDNDITRGFLSEAKGNIRCFSFRSAVENGVYFDGENLIYVSDGKTTVIMSRSDIRLPGDHNVENYMAAIAAVWGLVSKEDILYVARNFGGVKHRIEFVREVGGVRFYNDSIGSSPTRTLATLRSFPQKVHLLAGGYDKKIPFDELGKELSKYVKALYLSGHTAGKIREAVEQNDSSLAIHELEDYRDAVELAYKNAEPGDIVVLSPACASFDKFKNFEVRGEYFITCVKELKDNAENV